MNNGIITILLTTAGILSALTTIGVFFYKFNKIPKRFRGWLLEPTTEQIHDIRETLDETIKRIDALDNKMLKHFICDSSIPLTERLIAGEIYTNERHLNGEVKAIYEYLKECYEQKLKEDKK